MLSGQLVIGADHRPLEKAPDAFGASGVNVANYRLVDTEVARFMSVVLRCA